MLGARVDVLDVRHRIYSFGSHYPSLDGAIEALDPFQSRDHYSLHSTALLVAHYASVYPKEAR